MHRKEILNNGIVLLTEEQSQFMSASIGICLKTGSRYEKATERGVSHFIEHLLFKGTVNRSAREISTAIDSVGGILNASCGKEFTCYYAKVPDRDLPLAMDILSDMILNSLFSPEDIEKERTVILEEIKAIEDSPGDHVFDLYLRSVWNNHPLAVITSGDKESVMSLQREQIIDYFKRYYTPENMIVSVAGNIKHQEVSELLKEKLGTFKGSQSSRERDIPAFSSGHNINYRDSGQVHLCMGYPGISLRDDRTYVSIILDNIIGGTVSSRLFQKIREELGLVYSIYSFQNSFLDTGLFSFYGGSSPENVKKVIEFILWEIDEICNNGITEEQLVLSKNYVRGGMILSLESTSNRMFRLASSQLVYGRIVPIEEVLEKINNITGEDVLALARSIFKKDNLAICTLGPLREDDIDFSEFFSKS